MRLAVVFLASSGACLPGRWPHRLSTRRSTIHIPNSGRLIRLAVVASTVIPKPEYPFLTYAAFIRRLRANHSHASRPSCSRPGIPDLVSSGETARYLEVYVSYWAYAGNSLSIRLFGL
ncbi:hypothetical protein BDV59DRAFT_140522 [Aspergillus ambiguus]|uniref:uncharacterized protein n=1 Tax=Aspergillus ambiguus TaxID=176160 RepID=UPI003CCE47C4